MATNGNRNLAGIGFMALGMLGMGGGAIIIAAGHSLLHREVRARKLSAETDQAGAS